MRTALGVLLVAGAAVVPFTAHGAGQRGWTQITHGHSGAKANLGLARARDGTLHVLWAGPGRAPWKSILDTPIAASGRLGGPRPVLSNWEAVHPPAAVTTPDGAIHAIVSGQKTNVPTDPNTGLNEVVGPGAWKVPAKAFGNATITVASNADVRSAVLKDGRLISVWLTAATNLYEAGTDPATAPQRLTPTGSGPIVAVDTRSGEAIAAYTPIDNGVPEFRRIFPALGAPRPFPGARFDAPQLAARVGGGVYTAYTPDGKKVWLLRYAGRPAGVPAPKGVQILTAGLAQGPEGRLWVFYGNGQNTYVTRTNRRVSGFEPVQTFDSPPKNLQYFRLEGEGSAGALDLFADVTVDGGQKDGAYHRHVLPIFRLAVAKKPLRNRRGVVTAVQVTVRALDVGDPVAEARVRGLPGGAKATGPRGTIVLKVPPKRHGTFRLAGTKAGYLAATATLSL